ncbi:hypothetical protein U1Q18_006705 [Sarracenia purpurea var. burkii]
MHQLWSCVVGLCPRVSRISGFLSVADEPVAFELLGVFASAPFLRWSIFTYIMFLLLFRLVGFQFFAFFGLTVLMRATVGANLGGLPLFLLKFAYAGFASIDLVYFGYVGVTEMLSLVSSLLFLISIHLGLLLMVCVDHGFGRLAYVPCSLHSLAQCSLLSAEYGLHQPPTESCCLFCNNGLPPPFEAQEFCCASSVNHPSLEVPPALPVYDQIWGVSVDGLY